jgi:hypothetical protein
VHQEDPDQLKIDLVGVFFPRELPGREPVRLHGNILRVNRSLRAAKPM